MRIILLNEANEAAEIEELGGGNVRVTFENRSIAGTSVEKVVNLREYPSIAGWVAFAGSFILGVKEGITQPNGNRLYSAGVDNNRP